MDGHAGARRSLRGLPDLATPIRCFLRLPGLGDEQEIGPRRTQKNALTIAEPAKIEIRGQYPPPNLNRPNPAPRRNLQAETLS
jgi:hypothetical protein